MHAVGGQVNTRSYDRSQRQARSVQTRRRIIDAARELILENGYRATTIAAVAASAGVNADTVYQLVGRKPVLLRELIEQAISGTDHPIVADERDYVQAMKAEPDPTRKLAIYARAVCTIQGRLAPLLMALRDAASTEPEAEQVWHQISQRRAANMRRLILDVRTAGGLRPGLTVDEAADTVWALNSSEIYLLLTGERGWPPARFERWLHDTWCRLLLPPDAVAPSRRRTKRGSEIRPTVR
jgi:AcrR family transcriptional regulator